MPEHNASPTREIHVLITREAWDSALRPLLVAAERFAVGPIQWRREGTVSEALCSRLETADQLPSGLARPPLDDWLVVVMQADPGLSADQWVRRCEPRRSQRLIVIVLGIADLSRWDAALWDREELRDVAEISVVGGGGFRVERSGQDSPVMNPQELERSSRTAGALGQRVFRRVSGSTVTILGAGRLGSLLAFHVVGLGVSRLRLIDPDVLQWGNLDAMPGLTERDVGEPKVQVLAKRLLAFRRQLLVSYVRRSAMDPEAQRLMRRRTDLIVTSVDDDAPRLCASLIAKQMLTVHLDLATQVTRQAGEPAEIHADIRLLTPDRDGGCVACVGGLADVEQTLYQLGAPPGVLSRGEPVAWHQQRAGSLLTINSIAVGVAVQTWVDLLAGRLRSSYWHRLRWRPGAPLETAGSPVFAEPDCRFCQARDQRFTGRSAG